MAALGKMIIPYPEKKVRGLLFSSLTLF